MLNQAMPEKQNQSVSNVWIVNSVAVSMRNLLLGKAEPSLIFTFMCSQINTANISKIWKQHMKMCQ